MLTIALNLLDIAGNSFEAGATEVRILVEENIVPGLLTLEVADNGRGIDQAVLEHVMNPFYTTRTTRKVGLGLPLIRQQAEAAGGSLQIRSETGKGTVVTASFGLDHPDRQPLGDLSGVIVILAARDPGVRVFFTFRNSKGEVVFDTDEVKEVLEIAELNEGKLQKELRELLENQLMEISMTSLN